MNVHMCYTIQYSQYVKQTFLRLPLFEVTCSAEAALAILIAENKILCSQQLSLPCLNRLVVSSALQERIVDITHERH